jgi:hypothetical protein
METFMSWLSIRTLISIPRVLLSHSFGSLKQHLKGFRNSMISTNGMKCAPTPFSRLLAIDLLNVVLPAHVDEKELDSSFNF